MNEAGGVGSRATRGCGGHEYVGDADGQRGLGLVDADSDVLHGESVEESFSYTVGHGLNQIDRRTFDGGDHQVGHLAVVDSVDQVVGAGGLEHVLPPSDVDSEGLALLALASEDAVVGPDFDTDDVHCVESPHAV